jgi:hypothetical protein
LYLILAANSAGKFPADSKNRRKILPTKVLAGNQILQEIPQKTYFLRIFCPNPQENPQVIKRFLVVEVKRRFTIAYFITMIIILIIPSRKLYG